MSHLYTPVDPAWFKREVAARGCDGADLLEKRVVSKNTLTKLLNGKPVAVWTLRRVNAWLETTPIPDDLLYVVDGLK